MDNAAAVQTGRISYRMAIELLHFAFDALQGLS